MLAEAPPHPQPRQRPALGAPVPARDRRGLGGNDRGGWGAPARARQPEGARLLWGDTRGGGRFGKNVSEALGAPELTGILYSAMGASQIVEVWLEGQRKVYRTREFW